MHIFGEIPFVILFQIFDSKCDCLDSVSLQPLIPFASGNGMTDFAGMGGRGWGKFVILFVCQVKKQKQIIPHRAIQLN